MARLIQRDLFWLMFDPLLFQFASLAMYPDRISGDIPVNDPDPKAPSSVDDDTTGRAYDTVERRNKKQMKKKDGKVEG